jgi:hypothetical protein
MTDRLDGDQGAGEGNKQNMMINVNNLNYLLEPDLTVAVNATYKKHFFNADNFTSSRSAVCILNSGADYLDFRKSYLSFDFALEMYEGGKQITKLYYDPSDPDNSSSIQIQEEVATFLNVDPSMFVDQTAVGFDKSDPSLRLLTTAEIKEAIPSYTGPDQYVQTVSLRNAGIRPSAAPGVDIGFGGGSACNLIQRITIQSRSGDEICRIENAALLYHIQTNYCYDMQWRETIGSHMGSNLRWDSVTHTGQVRKRFHIPLYLLSGFFNYERLMPSMLASGLRITIDWADPISVLTAEFNIQAQHANKISFGYNVSRVEMDMKSIQLTDSCQRYLNEVSATSGLEIVYADYNNTIHQLPTSGGDVNLEVRQSCSRALRAFARIRGNQERKKYAKDSNASEVFTVTSWQWRLGSLYFPQQPVQARNVDSWKKESILWDSYRADDDTIYATRDLGDMYLSNEAETYLQAMETFGKADPHGHRCDVRLRDFSGYHFTGIPSVFVVGAEVDDGDDEDDDRWGRSLSPSLVTESLVNAYLGNAEKNAKALKSTDKDPRLQFIAASFSTENPDKPYAYFLKGSPEYQAAIAKGDRPFARKNFYSSKKEFLDFLKRIDESLVVRTYDNKQVAAFSALPTAKKAKTDYSQPVITSSSTPTPFVAIGLPAVNAGSYTDYTIGGNAIIPVNLERSTMFNLSGVPINNSRVLSLNMTLDTKKAMQLIGQNQDDIGAPNFIPLNGVYDHTADIFLQYVKLARVFLNNVEIEQ